MRLSNGEIIYTDPLNWDTDGDGIRDGDEIVRGGFGSIHGVLNDDGSYTFYSDYGMTFYMKSNPAMSDTDGDGISDKDDIAPLEIGIGNGIIGEISIVSYYKDGDPFTSGHSFLVYKSYINDTLDFSNFYTIFKKEIFNNSSYFSRVHESNMNNYTINKSEYITLDVAASGIGSSSGSNNSNSNNSLNNTKFNFNAITNNLDGGAWVDWELLQVAKANGKYAPNLALTNKITKPQLNDIINCYRESNKYGYSIYTNNCAKIATEAWNKAFNDDLNSWELYYTPMHLKSSISSRENSYEFDLENILKEMGFDVF